MAEYRILNRIEEQKAEFVAEVRAVREDGARERPVPDRARFPTVEEAISSCEEMAEELKRFLEERGHRVTCVEDVREEVTKPNPGLEVRMRNGKKEVRFRKSKVEKIKG